jgi:hypothetical protein
MPAKKAAKPAPPKVERPTPLLEAVPEGAQDTKSNFVKNFMWPMLMGLAAALVTALTTGLPNILADGLQPSDWPQIAGVLLAAGVGYLANVLTRYGGKGAPWVSPPVEPKG